MGKVLYIVIGEPDTGQSALGIFQEETAGCLFVFEDNERCEKADEINSVG